MYTCKHTHTWSGGHVCAQRGMQTVFLCTQLYDVSLVLETKLAETSSSVETSCLVKQAVL